MGSRYGFVALAAVAAVAGLPSTATAERAGPTKLSIVVREEGGEKIAVSLRCDPPSGTHPLKDDACVAIRSAGGDFEKLPGRQTFAACANVYLPVLARADGVAEGKTVAFKRTFPNRCEMGVATGSVFEVFPSP